MPPTPLYIVHWAINVIKPIKYRVIGSKLDLSRVALLYIIVAVFLYCISWVALYFLLLFVKMSCTCMIKYFHCVWVSINKIMNSQKMNSWKMNSWKMNSWKFTVRDVFLLEKKSFFKSCLYCTFETIHKDSTLCSYQKNKRYWTFYHCSNPFL